MGQCTSHSCVAVHDPSACMSPTPVPERAEKKKRGRLLRWSFSRKSKKTPIEAQQGQSRNCRNQKHQRCSDGGEDEQNNTQSINTLNNTVHSLDKAEESRDTNRVVTVDVHGAEDTTLHRHEEKVNTDEADVYSWHSCVSTLNTVQEVDAPRPEQEETNMNNCNSPTASSSVNARNTPTASSSTKEDLSAPLLSDDTFWKTEDEIINLSSNAKRGDIHEDYQIGRLLGQGGYGKVYEGTRLSDSRKVALKYVFKKECFENERLSLFGKLLPNEVAMMIRVSQGPSVPQIIKLLDWYETRTDYILVIERPVPCKDLRQYLVQNGGRISESKARVVMHQVVTAVRICFEKRIFHSDIKLENLLINENSLQVKLIDFGVSRSLNTFGHTRYFGTKLYAPPEAFHRTWRYHAKPATVYSLGVLLFVMLFGKYPYKVNPEVIADILRKAAISKESKELMSLCMETEPTKRIDLDMILEHDWFQVLLLKPETQNEEPTESEFPCADSGVLRKI